MLAAFNSTQLSSSHLTLRDVTVEGSVTEPLVPKIETSMVYHLRRNGCPWKDSRLRHVSESVRVHLDRFFEVGGCCVD